LLAVRSVARSRIQGVRSKEDDIMTRTFASSLVLATFAFGCAHQAQVTHAAPPKPREIVQAKADTRAPQVQSPVTEGPKAKEDAAIYFDFDSSLVREDARPVLQRVGDQVATNAASLKIEGNCDETGTTEYNIALGEARARAARDYLVHLGVSSNRIAIASYGSQRPKYPGHDETSHAKNRRDDLVVR
jgi:peptidoglycan-associated lipoprotein